MKREEMYSNNKKRRMVEIKDAVIVLGKGNGIRNVEVVGALGMDASAVTRRIDAARWTGGNAEMGRLQGALRS